MSSNGLPGGPPPSSDAAGSGAAALPAASASVLERLTFAVQRPAPEHLWIRFVPKGWRGPAGPWLDLAGGRLGRSDQAGDAPLEAMGPAAARPAAGHVALAIPYADPAALDPSLAPVDDVVYLPPVPRHMEAERDRLAARLAAAGVPVVLQLLPGDLTAFGVDPAGAGSADRQVSARTPSSGAAAIRTEVPRRPALVDAALDVTVVLDLSPALFGVGGGGGGGGRSVGGAGGGSGGVGGASGDDRGVAARVRDACRAAGAGGAAPPDVVVFPLVAGLTDSLEVCEHVCGAVAAAGVGCIQFAVPVLGPGERRRLAAWVEAEDAAAAGGPLDLGRDAEPQEAMAAAEDEAGQAYAALFHRAAPAEREYARLAWRCGLAPFLRRPLPRSPLRGAANRRTAGLLALVADLWLRTGRQPVEQAQALFRAARWLDDTDYDIDALRRDGNLAVLTALDPLARRLVGEAAAEAEPELLRELLAEYLGQPAVGG